MAPGPGGGAHPRKRFSAELASDQFSQENGRSTRSKHNPQQELACLADRGNKAVAPAKGGKGGKTSARGSQGDKTGSKGLKESSQGNQTADQQPQGVTAAPQGNKTAPQESHGENAASTVHKSADPRSQVVKGAT